MLVSESISDMTDGQPAKMKRRNRSLVMRDINKKLKKIKRQVGSFDAEPTSNTTTTTVDDSTSQSDVENNGSGKIFFCFNFTLRVTLHIFT